MLPVLEYSTSDVNQYALLALGKSTAAGLRQATNGQPDSSQRFREVLEPMGIQDELTAAFVVDSTFWACARLYRDNRWPVFDSVEIAFVASLCPTLAEGFRTALISPGVDVVKSSDGPGVLVLDEMGEIESITPGVDRLLTEVIDDVNLRAGSLPRPVRAVAARTRALASSGARPLLARCRVPTRSGRWLTIHGTQLEGGPDGRVAVIIEPAASAELAPLIVRAYGLTERERQVVAFVLQGLSTKQIAMMLGVSPYTVSDHLRVVFEKVSVSSRTELAARVFFDQYYPRIYKGDPIGSDGWFLSIG